MLAVIKDQTRVGLFPSIKIDQYKYVKQMYFICKYEYTQKKYQYKLLLEIIILENFTLEINFINL